MWSACSLFENVLCKRFNIKDVLEQLFDNESDIEEIVSETEDCDQEDPDCDELSSDENESVELPAVSQPPADMISS